MFSNKEVMKWQRKKQHSHMGYTCRHSGTKLCTRARNQFPQRNLLEKAEARQRIQNWYPNNKEFELLKRKPNYTFKKALSFLEMLWKDGVRHQHNHPGQEDQLRSLDLRVLALESALYCMHACLCSHVVCKLLQGTDWEMFCTSIIPVVIWTHENFVLR